MNNNKENITVVFSDLEGTLIDSAKKIDTKESKIDSDKFLKLIENIHKFLQLTETKLIFAIVSPIEAKYMEPILEEIDELFFQFNKEHNTKYKTELAACYKENNPDKNFAKAILPILNNCTGKKAVVDTMTDSLGYRFNIKNTIYMGNGRNDISSVEFLHGKYKENAFTICPQNSKTKLRENPRNYIGDGEALEGLNSGFEKIFDYLKSKSLNTPNDCEEPDIR